MNSTFVNQALNETNSLCDVYYLDDYTYADFLDNLDQLPHDSFLPDPLPKSWRYIAAFLYICVIIFAVVGNVLVILVFAKHPVIQTVTNRFLVSLAMSDLCIALLNMPFSLLLYMRNEWLLGEFWCKFSNYLQGVFIVSTIFTLSILAIDR